jgi:hypothetical protein
MSVFGIFILIVFFVHIHVMARREIKALPKNAPPPMLPMKSMRHAILVPDSSPQTVIGGSPSGIPLSREKSKITLVTATVKA